MKDPGGCEKTDSTDAEPREEARLPRSPRHLHPASRRRRRSLALWSEHVAAAFTPPHTGPPLSGWITMACCSSAPPPPIYRLDAILSLGSIHYTGGCLIGSACHQHLSIQHQSVSANTQHPHPRAQTPASTQKQWLISLYHYKKYTSILTVVTSLLP